MALDMRLIFLLFLFLSGIVFFIRNRGALLTSLEPGQMLLDFFLVLLFIGTATSFFFALFRIDPMPYIRDAAYQLSLQQVVSFESAIPPDLSKSLSVTDVNRLDTDGDDFEEWVVHYRFNTRDGNGPLQVVVYDNDRGNPPVIFPYVLRVPGRDYLSEGGATLELHDVTTDDKNGPNQNNLPELLVKGERELSIFRFRQNSEPWDFPRDAPPRYISIGFFRGSGGVTFDDETKSVTVIDRDGFERSQLVVRSVYQLNRATRTYWDRFYEPTELERKLAAPTFSTVDFLNAPPVDILSVSFPEMIVLAFYASTCEAGNDTLCSETTAAWSPGDFLAEDARLEYDNNNPAYFGLSGFNNTRDLAISDIAYFPNLETDPDLAVTGGGRDTVIGEQAQQNVVQVTFVVNSAAPQTARYQLALVNGQWKIVRRLPFKELPELSAPTRINAPQ